MTLSLPAWCLWLLSAKRRVDSLKQMLKPLQGVWAERWQEGIALT